MVNSMDARITIQELAASFASRAGIRIGTASEFVRNFFEVIAHRVVEDKIVKVKGLGTFKLIEMSERESVDVNTGERILIPGHTKISFTPDAALRDQVNKPFADFQTVILNEGTSIEEMEAIPDEIAEKLTLLQAEPTETENDAVEETEEAIVTNEVVEEVEETTEGEVLAQPEEETNQPLEETIRLKEEATQPEETALQPEEEETPVVVAPVSVPQPVMEAVPQVKVIHKGVSPWFTLVYMLLTLLLMGLSYYAGYRRLLSFDDHRATKEVKAVPRVKTPVKAAVPEPVDSLTLARQRAKKAAQEYPQVPGGKYLIVGTRRVHVMRVGDSLLKLALKEYGHKDFAQYIIISNKFPNPDVIPVGSEVKLPELIENGTE